jgi:hypothetical protein
LEKLRANAVEDIKRYQATLGPVLAVYERELERQVELAAARRGLYERGALSEAELRAGQRAVEAAQRDVDQTRRAIAEADRMLREVTAAEGGQSQPPR